MQILCTYNGVLYSTGSDAAGRLRLSPVLLWNHVKIDHFYSLHALKYGGSQEVNFRDC
jgi:hypothetical protein